MIKKIIHYLFTLIISVNMSGSMFIDSLSAAEITKPKQMEYLTRGAIGAIIDGNVYLSWRLLGTEPMDTKFNIYCNGEKIINNLNNTNYTHIGGNKNNKYQISSVINGKETAKSNYVNILQGKKDSDLSKGNFEPVPYAYFDIPIDPPPDGDGCTYKNNNMSNPVFSEPRLALGGANDASVGDLDGDGEYEIILKWNPSNAHDNSENGKTGNTYIDAYKMDGTKLWRIDLGKNIRSGSHYTQYIVYDLDYDGKAEIAMKTAPGSIDGTGKYVTEAGSTDKIKDADNNISYVNSKGRILDGPEYLTVFNGKTGEAVQTIDYYPERGDINKWGKSNDNGNRVDRFLAGVAYLDGVHPSLIMCRGYYGRSVVVAYDWNGTNLSKKWVLDSGTDSSNNFYGQGNHSLSVADLDNDGFDEIVYGSAAVDHDGKVLHSTKWGHGDALHVSDFNNDGKQEIFSVLEEKPNYGTAYRDGDTGKEFWHSKAGQDTGRGIMINASSKYNPLGFSSEDGNFFDSSGNKLSLKRVGGANFAVYWDGDLYRELSDGLTITKVKDDYGMVKIWDIGINNPVETNNSTKNNICLQADLFGVWLEEMVLRHNDNSALRIFISLAPTDYKLTTLMHDSQYRCAVAWQNVGYNQPPHPSYYIGPDKTNYKQPNIKTFSIDAIIDVNNLNTNGDKVNFESIIKSKIEVKNAIVVASLYDSNGTLVDSKNFNTSFEVDTPKNINFELNKKNIQNLTLKIFIWDSLDNMKPVFKTKAYSQSLENS